MFGNYVMVAANYGVHPKGSIVKSSLGLAIVVDTRRIRILQPSAAGSGNYLVAGESFKKRVCSRSHGIPRILGTALTYGFAGPGVH